MTKNLSPLVSEFETQEQAESYDRWYREKVDAAMHSTHAVSSHDDVIGGARKIINEIKARRKLA